MHSPRGRAARGAAEARAALERYERLVDAIEGIVWEASADLRDVTFVSGFAERLLGYPPHQWVDEADFWRRHVHAEDLPAFERSLDDANPPPTEFRMIANDGRAVWLRNIMTAFGGAGARIGVMVDVTQRHEAEGAIRESERAFRRIVETAQEGVCILDARGHLVYANARWAQMLRVPLQEIVDRPVVEIVHEEDRDAARSHIDHRRRGVAETFELRFRRGDGSVMWGRVSATPIMAEDGSYHGSFSMVTDLSEARAAEGALRLSEENYRTIFQSANDAIFVHDADTGAILDVNPRFSEMLGYAPDDARKLTVADLSAEEPPYTQEEAMRRIRRAAEGEPQLFEWRGRHASGRLVWVEVNLQRVHLGGVPRVLAVVRDITQRKAAEEELSRYRERLEDLVKERTQQLEAVNRELEAFSYSVSHDLRAPLRGVSYLGDALIEDHGEALGEDGQDLVRSLQRETRRASQLVDDLLTLSRISQVDLRRIDVDVTALARDVAATLARRNPSRRVDIRISDNIRAGADPRLLRVVFENLLGNAWKYTGKRKDAKIRIGARKDGGQQVIYVEDNGVGFDMHQASRLFRPFQRLATASGFEGTGVGLATVHRIVERHGGRIWAEGTAGQGSRFFFTLG